MAGNSAGTCARQVWQEGGQARPILRSNRAFLGGGEGRCKQPGQRKMVRPRNQMGRAEKEGRKAVGCGLAARHKRGGGGGRAGAQGNQQPVKNGQGSQVGSGSLLGEMRMRGEVRGLRA